MQWPWVRRIHFNHLVKLLEVQRELIKAYKVEIRKLRLKAQ